MPKSLYYFLRRLIGMLRVIKRMARNERGFTTLLIVTLIVSSLSGWKFGTSLAKGPTNDDDFLNLAYDIESYVRKQVEVNKKDIELVIDTARNMGKQRRLKVAHNYDSFGIYNIVIYQELPDRVVRLYDFNVMSDKGR